MGSCEEFLGCRPGEAIRDAITINKFNLGVSRYSHWLGIEYPYKTAVYSVPINFQLDK